MLQPEPSNGNPEKGILGYNNNFNATLNTPLEASEDHGLCLLGSTDRRRAGRGAAARGFLVMSPVVMCCRAPNRRSRACWRSSCARALGRVTSSHVLSCARTGATGPAGGAAARGLLVESPVVMCCRAPEQAQQGLLEEQLRAGVACSARLCHLQSFAVLCQNRGTRPAGGAAAHGRGMLCSVGSSSGVWCHGQNRRSRACWRSSCARAWRARSGTPCAARCASRRRRCTSSRPARTAGTARAAGAAARGPPMTHCCPTARSAE